MSGSRLTILVELGESTVINKLNFNIQYEFIQVKSSESLPEFFIHFQGIYCQPIVCVYNVYWTGLKNFRNKKIWNAL